MALAAFALIAIATAITIPVALNTFTDQQQRRKMLSQVGASLTALLVDGQNRADARKNLATALGPRLMDKYVWVTESLDPAADDILMIERPTAFAGNWLFAVYGDAHVRKINRDEAVEIVLKAEVSTKSGTATP